MATDEHRWTRISRPPAARASAIVRASLPAGRANLWPNERRRYNGEVRLTAFLLFAAAVSWLPAACSGDDAATTTTGVAPESNAATPAAAASPASPAATAVPAVTETPAVTQTIAPAPTPVSTDAGLLTVVDKQTALPAGYEPPDLSPLPAEWAAPGFGGLLLRAEAADALAQMLAAARAADYELRVRSAYRSYAEQQATFQYWVQTLGEAEARRLSAEPGHSEHQLGTAVDLTNASLGYDLNEGFGATAEGQWLAAHGHEHGFALSYPAGKEDVTGYAYEPWHFRYVGLAAAKAWRESGLTLVEWLRGSGS